MWASGLYGYLFDYLWWWAACASLIVHTWCFFRFFPRDRRPRIRLVLGNTLATLCLLSVVGIGAETYLRFFYTDTDAFGVTLTAKRWLKVYPKLNSWYCRDIEWTEGKPDGVRRVAFVGDSFTYGWGIRNEDDLFVSIIRRRLAARSPGRVEVMNVAWAAWDTQNEINAIRDMAVHYDIDEVVLCHLPNDIETLLSVSEDRNPTKPPTSTFLNVQRSFLLDYLFHRMIAPRRAVAVSYFDWLWDGYRDPATWSTQRARYDRMIAMCAEHGVSLRIALLPFIRSWGDRYDPEALHEQLASFFASKRVPVVDLLPVINRIDPKELVVNAHDPHPNERANALFAEGIRKAFFADPAP